MCDPCGEIIDTWAQQGSFDDDSAVKPYDKSLCNYKNLSVARIQYNFPK